MVKGKWSVDGSGRKHRYNEWNASGKVLFIQWILIPNTTGMSGNVSRAVSTNSTRSKQEEEKNWDAKLFAGEITWFEYYRKLYTNLSDEGITGIVFRIWIWIAE